jgi:hypothetical protein
MAPDLARRPLWLVVGGRRRLVLLSKPIYPYPDYIAEAYSEDEYAAPFEPYTPNYPSYEPYEPYTANPSYYCDYPPGYYPYVQNCTYPWRAVPPQRPRY